MLLLLACHHPPPAPPAWDTPAPAVACEEAPAPLLDAALEDARLSRGDLRFRPDDWSRFDALVDGPLLPGWWTDVHHRPEQADCFQRQLQADLDAAAATAHPAASVLGAWAGWLGHPLRADPPEPGGAPEEELSRLAALTGGGAPPALDPDVGVVLAPILRALSETIEAREAMVEAARGWRRSAPKELFDGSAALILAGPRLYPDLSDPAEVTALTEWYLGDNGPRALTDPARRVAFAVEHADWSGLLGRDLDWRYETPMGDVIIAPGSATTHGRGPVLLLLDLGGDDTYEGTAGANANVNNGVSITIDLGGADTWTYEAAPDPGDAPDGPPADRDGRDGISLSDTARQGAGRLGVGMLFDLGPGDDTYTSLRASQGYGNLGLGLLYDEAGDDRYLGEAGVQGAAVLGVGVAIDGAGHDTRHTWAFGQGFGWVGSGGLALDVGEGDDVWRSDPGRDYGGTTLYASAQLAGGEGNSSFTQGAGFGLRADAWGLWLPGGLGVLRDGGGDDTYTAGVFAQGTGYWQGTGVLADAGGDDTYDAIWYVQGGAAHFAVGILVDSEGDDTYGGTIAPRNVSLGAGHDLSLGLLIEGGGDDHYTLTTLAAGASNCQGIGILADLDGADTWSALSPYGVGLGNHSGECGEATGRTTIPSIGLFMDSGGDPDTWSWPAGDPRAPGDDARFGIAWSGGSAEHGGAADGEGATGFLAR